MQEPEQEDEPQPPPTAPLIVTPAVVLALHELRHRVAKSAIVDMTTLAQVLADPKARAEHHARIAAQTMQIPGPWPFYVTLAFEAGHPIGPCRHLSMNIDRLGRIPSEEAVKLIATTLGFESAFDGCHLWAEPMSDGRRAVHVVQPLTISPASSA